MVSKINKKLHISTEISKTLHFADFPIEDDKLLFLCYSYSPPPSQRKILQL